MHTLGIILAGGASRRMGLPAGASKAAALLGGRPLLAHVCRAVRPVVDRLVVVAAPGQSLPPVPDIDDVVRDSRPGAGPLAGIADALRAAPADTDRAFIASCDVPLLRTDIVRLIVGQLADPDVRWVVPWVGDHPQVLASALRPSLLPEIESHLAAGRRDPRGLVERLRMDAAEPGGVRFVPEADLRTADPQLVSFIDVDTPNDLARIDERLLYSAPWRRDIPDNRGGSGRADAG